MPEFFTSKVVYHVPDRFAEGYGMNEEIVRKLAQDGVSLIITCDCGISNVREITLAKELGMDVVLTDHHTVPALANYNYLLKELYGLMALSSDDPDLLMEEIIYYLERNLMVEGIKEHKTKAESTLDTINESETVKNIKKFLGVDKKKEEKSLDLYDYKIENVKVQPIYNLSEPEVLRAQILEYMKYRGPKELSEGLMDKFLALKDFKKQADILKEKLDVDKNLTEIKENEVKASDNMVTVNKFATDANIPNQLDLAAQYIAKS